MIIRQPSNSRDAKSYDTERLREEFLIKELFIPGKIKRVYSHIDRIITMGYCPSHQAQELSDGVDVMKTLGSNTFLQGRELGMINIGGPGKVTVDGQVYDMKSYDGLYVGRGHEKVIFESNDPSNPSKFYALSAPAHKAYPSKHIDIETAKQVPLGSQDAANKRIIFQFIHPDVVDTCQLMMGLTKLDQGNVWNTMPCHTHERRMEVYFYFDMKEDDTVFHLMGEPDETRHIVVRNEEAVISPSWSIHSGCGTSSYNFIWGMVGENKTFTDMDAVAMTAVR